MPNISCRISSPGLRAKSDLGLFDYIFDNVLR